ncbi:MAG: hypothetical protein PHY72_02060 [Candidatus Pacebacteria bacterium]|nr:hypothetical protein [Candidatus Paceibacterota bacterium]
MAEVSIRESIFSSPNIGFSTTCEWILVKIISSFRYGATADQVWDCVETLLDVLRKMGKPFFFWLGPGINVKGVLARMESQGILINHNPQNLYIMARDGEESLKDWIDDMVKILNLPDVAELDRIILSCVSDKE